MLKLFPKRRNCAGKHVEQDLGITIGHRLTRYFLQKVNFPVAMFAGVGWWAGA